MPPPKKPGRVSLHTDNGTPHLETAPVLVDYDQLPAWAQENPHITTGYRPITGCLTGCLASLRYWHNETANIYSHLLPLPALLLEIARSLLVLLDRHQIAGQSRPRREDVLAFAAFFAGAVGCMVCSAAYHTLKCHSQGVATRCKQLDYVGITGLIWGSFVPTIYYLFTCEVGLMLGYLVTITAIASVLVGFFLSPLARQAWTMPLRAPMFVMYAASAVTPLWTGLKMYGWEHLNQMVGLQWVLLQGVIYLLGLMCFLTEMPERAWPGRFNFFSSSHQLFHIAVVLAATAQFVGLLSAYRFQHEHYQVAICPLLQTWKSELLIAL